MKQLKIIINDDILNEYYHCYFKRFPRRKKKPIKSPIPPSLNELFSMNRHALNSIKKNWQEFGVWLVEQNDYQNLMIEKCKITINYYFGTLRKRDLDNVSCKGIMDAFTETKMFLDDNFKIIRSITVNGFYLKNAPRTEIIIDYGE